MRKCKPNSLVLSLILIIPLFLAGSHAYGQSSQASISVNLNGNTTEYLADTSVLLTDQDNEDAVFSLADNQSFLSESGQPQLPFQVIRMLLAPDADLKAVTAKIAADYSTIDGTCNIIPMPAVTTWDQQGNQIILWPENANIVDGYNIDIYSAKDFWPPVQAKVINTGELRSYKIAEIAVPLFRYNPVTYQLQKLEYADVDIISAQDKTATKASAADISGLNNPAADRIIDLVDNYQQAAADYGYNAETKSPNLSLNGFVIVTTNTIKNNSTKLAAYVADKEASGFQVAVVTETNYGTGTGDTAANNIRAFLQNNYQNANFGNGGILYALLIGDPRTTSSSVPMKLCGEDFPTDYFYAELSSDWDADGDGIYGESEDTTDKYFEIYVGRIPYYGTITETDAILQKLIDYNNETDTAWRRNALLPMVPLDDSTQAYQTGEQIKYNLLEPQAIPSDRIYENNYSLNPVPEYLLDDAYPANVWAAGQYGMVIWQTHGWESGASDVITTSEAANLNDDYPSVVYQGSCMNGNPETTTNLGYSILKNGGISTVAASRNGLYWVGQTNFTNTNSVGGIGYQYAKHLANRKTVGQALWDAKESLSFWQQNYFVYNLYGDPSITVMPELPELTATPTHGACFSTTFGGNTTDSAALVLTNNSSAAISWTAATDQQTWYTISADSGTISAGATKSINVVLNSEAVSALSVGDHISTITFTDTTNSKVIERKAAITILPKKKIAYWPFESTSGTTAYDLSGNGNDGTVTNTDFATATATGVYGNAFNFDGSDDHIEVPDYGQDMNAMTISVWINATNWSSNRRIIQKGSDSSEYRLLAERSAFVFEIGSNRLELTEMPTTGQWVHIAAVYDGSEMRLYYDKVLKGTISRTGTVPSSTASLFIGTKNASSGSTDRFIGLMDELQIFNYAKDEDGIANLYDGIIDPEPVYPYDGSAYVLLVENLQWQMTSSAVSNNVYLSNNYYDLLNANTHSAEFMTSQTDTTYIPGILKPNKNYYWRIDQVTSDGTVNKGPIWQFATGNGTGGITREVWLNISGTAVTSLTSSSNYPDSPDETGILTSFEAPSGYADNYGQRIHGFFIPPVDGQYSFAIASDDYSELWISQVYNTSSMTKAAYMYGATDSREWTQSSSQVSNAYTLQAGRPYYIKALHKEGTIGDNCAVAYKGPGMSSLQVIPGEYLMPYSTKYSWGPAFAEETITAAVAGDGVEYNYSIAGTASATYSGQTVQYSKLAGPLWLEIAADGSLSGTPSLADLGLNCFEIEAIDQNSLTSAAFLNITVLDAFSGQQGLTDFAGLAKNWMIGSCPDLNCQRADLTGDGAVSVPDLEVLAANWLTETSAASSLVAYWSFENGLKDETDNAYTAQAQNGVYTVAITENSLRGSAAVEFDGTDDYLQVTDYDVVSDTGSTGFTTSAWIKTTVTQLATVLSFGGDSAGNKWGLIVNAEGKLALAAVQGYQNSNAKVNDGQWHHVAAVLNNIDNPQLSDVKLYLDGNLLTTTATATMTLNITSGQDLLIGAISLSSQPRAYFKGMIDEVKIFDRPLAAAEIRNVVNADIQLYYSAKGVSTYSEDSSIYLRDGVSDNPPTITTDNCDVVMQFSGSNYITVPGYKGPLSSQSRSLMTMVKFTGSSMGVIANWGHTTAGENWMVRIEADGSVWVGAIGSYVKTSVTIKDGLWHHLAVTLDGSEPNVSDICIYVDGSKKAAVVTNDIAVNTIPGGDLEIGAVVANGNRTAYFNGLLDELRIYNRSLNEEEIQADYQNLKCE